MKRNDQLPSERDKEARSVVAKRCLRKKTNIATVFISDNWQNEGFLLLLVSGIGWSDLRRNTHRLKRDLASPVVVAFEATTSLQICWGFASLLKKMRSCLILNWSISVTSLKEQYQRYRPREGISWWISETHRLAYRLPAPHQQKKSSSTGINLEESFGKSLRPREWIPSCSLV